MKASAHIDPGICNFNTTVKAETEDSQKVTFEFISECATVKEFGRQVAEVSPVDAIMSLGPQENPILSEARALLQGRGCCEACIVPAAAVKAMQVITNLALPKDASIEIIKE